MRRITPLDLAGAFALWTGMAFLLGVVLAENLFPKETVLAASLGVWALGLAAGRVWWLRRAGESAAEAAARIGLSTGEMTAQRLAEMEARIYELEERLELTERLLEQVRSRSRLPLVREVTPV